MERGRHTEADRVIDIALTEMENTGKPIAHRIDCEEVRRARMEGRPIMTLFEVREPLPKDMRQHDCLKRT